MSCKKTKSNIYLYDELTTPEKTEVDTHLLHCEGCLKLFQEMQQLKMTLHNVSSLKKKVNNPWRLTQAIMQSIETNAQYAQPNVIISFFDSLFARYALSAISMLLVIIFIIEQQRDFKPSQSQVVRATDNPEVILNTNSFLRASQRELKKEPGKLTSLYACLKSNNCDNSFIRNFKSKKPATHENI